MVNLLKRLDDEVRRLGGPVKVAKLLGVAKGTVYNWIEKGNIPADKLEALDIEGADTGYIITGRRNPPGIAGTAGESKKLYSKPEDALTAALNVQNRFGLSFSASQLKALIGFAWHYQANEDDLAEFVKYAYGVAGVELP
ncbi:MAG: Cro/CI family transcriptional regulator [Anaerolineaceae bacterium]|nr:Cro/CI family transcriptional regulator [Anaerolineaceae bacterium]